MIRTYLIGKLLSLLAWELLDKLVWIGSELLKVLASDLPKLAIIVVVELARDGVGHRVPGGPHELADHLLETLVLVEAGDLLEHLVHRSEYAGLWARQTIAIVFQPEYFTILFIYPALLAYHYTLTLTETQPRQGRPELS